MKIWNKFQFFVFVFCLFLMSTKPAFAYVDPGTGSYIVQIIIATLLGIMFSVKMLWFKIKHFVLKIFRR